MADLQIFQDFAATQGFDLTNPLEHDEVVRLAEYWLPRTFFYEKEKFHPIALDEYITMVEDLFNSLPPEAQDKWRVAKRIRTSPVTSAVQKFDPPVVHIPDGLVQSGSNLLPCVRILNAELSTREALMHPDIDDNAVITHGASFNRSNHFFGSALTMSGGIEAAPGDPFLPRATGDDSQPVTTILVSFQNLLETLKYELAVEEADDYPPDGLRGGFNIAHLLFRRVFQNFPLLPDHRRNILQALIEAHETGESLSIPLEMLPPGWVLNKTAWDAVTRYAFLQYDFLYAYNDFDRVQTTPFENEHEGDNEGCCLVFDRNVINLAAAGEDPDSLFRAVPHSIITSVHEEIQDADLFRFISPPIPSPENPDGLPRDDMNLDIYIALGSHATYLSPGNHDLVDFGDTFNYVQEWFPIPIITIPVGLVLGIIVSMIDHFVDTEDKTSEDGIVIGPENSVADNPRSVAKRMTVMPMSADRHIYQESEEDLLRLRAYPGKWGGHHGIIDKSPVFGAKTGRYFSKLLSKL